MLKKGNNMRKTALLLSTLILLFGCETGVKNKHALAKEAPSGIVDKVDNPGYSYSKSSYKASSNKIFSNSAQPGFYLQMAVFEKYKPNKSFLAPLNRSSFGYIQLEKYGKRYVLIGPYKSYNAAKNKISAVNAKLHKRTFVVQVLRP
jgi:hypothetical protein